MAAAPKPNEALMPKLTDTQLVILSAVAQRQDRAVLPLPKSLKIKGGAATKTLEGLREKGLLNEKPAARNAAAQPEALMEAYRQGQTLLARIRRLRRCERTMCYAGLGASSGVSSGGVAAGGAVDSTVAMMPR